MKDEFLKTATELSCTKQDSTEPLDSDLRRSISSAYYAAFHFVLEQCADLLTGDAGGQDLGRAWLQTYRGITHEDVRKACNLATDGTRHFPTEIRLFASSFSTWIEERHEADYNPRPLLLFRSRTRRR